MAHHSRSRTLLLASILNSQPYNPWHYYIVVASYAGVITVGIFIFIGL